MSHKLWWILGGIFLLSKTKTQPVTTPAGGMSAAQPAADAIGSAINQNGALVSVVQPLATTVTGTMANATFGTSVDDDALAMLPALPPGVAQQGVLGAAAGPFFVAPPIQASAAPGQVPITGAAPISAIFKISPPAGGVAPGVNDPGAMTAPLLAPLSDGTIPPGMAPGDPRASNPVPVPVSFDLTKDVFFVPGIGEESFSQGAFTPDQKLSILRAQGYTGADPRQVATTPTEAAMLAQPPINPTTGRVSLPNV